MARKELMASTEETRECVTRMLRRKVKTMRSEEDGIYVEGFLPFSLMEEVVELLRTAKKFQREVEPVARHIHGEIQAGGQTMITEQELKAVTDRKERFELSMLYMQLHGMPPYLDPLTLDDVRQIRNAVLHVTQGMDYTSMKEGSEYFNVETGDNAYKAMQELKKKQADEMAQRQMMERMQREADEEAARAFHFSHMDTLNDAGDLTVTQIVTEIVKAQALRNMMVGWLYKGILDCEIMAAKTLIEERIKIASKQELDAYNTFRRYHIFTRMGDDATSSLFASLSRISKNYKEL